MIVNPTAPYTMEGMPYRMSNINFEYCANLEEVLMYIFRNKAIGTPIIVANTVATPAR
ncbi:hypothetical protein D3C86_1744240 [compost metagenome]